MLLNCVLTFFFDFFIGRAQKWGEVKKKTKERSKKQEHDSYSSQDKHHHNATTRSSSSKNFSRGPKTEKSSSSHPRSQKTPQKPHSDDTSSSTNLPNPTREPTTSSSNSATEPVIPPSSASSNTRSWADMARTQSKLIPVSVPINDPSSTSSLSPNDSDTTITVKIPSSTTKDSFPETNKPISDHTSLPDSSTISTGPASAMPLVIPISTPAAPIKKSWADIAAPPPPATKPATSIPVPEPAPIEPEETIEPNEVDKESSSFADHMLIEKEEIAEPTEETETEPSIPQASEADNTLKESIPTEPESEPTPVVKSEPVSSETSAVTPSIPTGPAATSASSSFPYSTDSSAPAPPGLEKTVSPAVPEETTANISVTGLTSNSTAPITTSTGLTGSTPTAPASGNISRSNANDTQRPISLPSQPAVSTHTGYSRRLNQDSPVVLPGSSYNSNSNPNINRVNAQFGSLNLAEDESSQDKNEISAPTQPRAAMEQQQNQGVYSQPHQSYNNYNRFNQRSNNQYQNNQSQPQQAGQSQGQQQTPHKSFENYNQSQYMYPGTHPGYGGYSYGDYSYPSNDAARNTFGGYYSPYPQQHPQDALNRGLNQYEQPGMPQQTSRFTPEKTQIAAGATSAAAQSPANNGANQGLASTGSGPGGNQYNNLPYFMNPYYSYPYFVSNNYANQKPYYGQQSYFAGGVDYRSQQGGPQQGNGQPTPQQPGAQAQGSQQGQQPNAVGGQNSLSGISDFLQREDKGTPSSPQALVGAQVSGQPQLHQSQQQQYQQNMYNYPAYGTYGGGRQNWNYN